MFPAALLAFTTSCATTGRHIDGAGGRAVAPRLVVRPPGDVHIEGRRASRTLRFAMAVENRGPGDLELVGRRDPASGRTVAVQQVLARSGSRRAVDHELAVGTLAFDGHHGHWHLGGFARFELLDERLAPARGARPAAKVSACLRDSERLRLRGGATVPRHFLCSSERQGITVGWADVYDSELPGQEINIAGTPDGVYLLVITLTAPFESAGPSSERVGAARLRIAGRRVQVLETLDGRALEALRAGRSTACGCAGGCSCGATGEACGCARRHAVMTGRRT